MMGYIVGLGIGCIGMCLITYKSIKIIERLTEEAKLKTNLLNWVVEVGVHLEADEFYLQYKEKARFINIVGEQEDE
jgi:hypothetical protein